MKIKTFIFNTNQVNPYDGKNEFHYRPETDIIDEEINRFINGVTKVYDLKTTTHQQGNNPPTFFIDYTILYDE